MLKKFHRYQILRPGVLKHSGFIVLLSLVIPCFQGCDSLTDSDEEKNDKLYIKFINEAASQYTITTIQLQPMGKAGEASTPSGTWSDNILTNGKTIAPGAHEFFNLTIENMHWNQYRLGVDDGTGNEIMLHTQEGYDPLWELPITHWGSDERTVSVTVRYDETSGQITVSGYSDFAGIED